MKKGIVVLLFAISIISCSKSKQLLGTWETSTKLTIGENSMGYKTHVTFKVGNLY